MLLLPAVQAAREAARPTSDGDSFEFTSDTEALSTAGVGSAHTAGYWDLPWTLAAWRTRATPSSNV